MTAASALIAEQGLTVTDRHGQVRPHPAVAIERDSRVAFVRVLRELGLSDEANDSRPPRLTGRYAGRGLNAGTDTRRHPAREGARPEVAFDVVPRRWLP